MSLKRMLLASSAAVALIAPATDASAQYQPYRQHYSQPAAPGHAQRQPKAQPAPKPVAPEPPLSEEQAAAKAEIDALMTRDPTLAAAKERPDPRLAKAAAARHDARERRLAMLKAKEEAAVSKRRELAEKAKAREEAREQAREEAKAAAKPKQDKPKQDKPKQDKPKQETQVQVKGKLANKQPTPPAAPVATLAPAPVPPPPRMPAP